MRQTRSRSMLDSPRSSSYSSEYDPVTGIQTASSEVIKLRKYFQRTKKEIANSLKELDRKFDLLKKKMKSVKVKDTHVYKFHANNMVKLENDIRKLKGLPSVAKPKTREYLKGVQKRRTAKKNANRGIVPKNKRMDDLADLFNKSFTPYQKRDTDMDDLTRMMRRTL